MAMEKILIIEDNEFNREIAETTLKKQGYDVITAVDGKEGLEKISQKPDLILLDLSLPKVSGWEIVKKVREDEEIRTVPILALTAHAMVGDREKAMRMGCSAYLSKPCLPSELVKEVESILNEYKE
ncbi:MAG: response regulator [Elusimicrobiota bacterium]